MRRGRRANVALINEWEQLLRDLVVTHFDKRFDTIEASLAPRVDRCESDIRDHAKQIRELYSMSAANQARLDNLEKKN